MQVNRLAVFFVVLAFSLVVVAAKSLSTTTTNGLCGGLFFVFYWVFGLPIGCGLFHKLITG
jgi:hypothetical protein